MTGWRLGVCMGPEDLISKMGLCLETISSCVTPFIQRAGIEAIKGSQKEIFEMRNEYRESREFGDVMLNEAGVALTPGPIFGENGEGYVRLSYCNSMENIEKGIQRMRNALEGGSFPY